MEQSIVLFRVPESTKDSPENRQKDDIKFFSDFCINGLSCNLPEIQKAIMLGESPSPTDQIRRKRPLKIVLRDRTEKEEIFKSLKNLKTADPSYRGICFSHDYYKETRELIKLKLSEAREKDGQKAERYMYFISGPASRLEVQRRKRKYIPQPESKNDDF